MVGWVGGWVRVLEGKPRAYDDELHQEHHHDHDCA